MMLDGERQARELAAAAEDYLWSAFGQRLHLEPITPSSLPNYLVDRYQIWRSELLSRPTLFVAWKYQEPGAGFTASFIKHREILGRQLGAELVLLLLDRAPSVIRRQLVERKVAFLAPGAQLYVPELLLDLSERGKPSFRSPSAPQTPSDEVSPTAQVLLIAALLHEQISDSNLSELAKRYDVSVMSMSRAADELEGMGIAKSKRVGRQRRLEIRTEGRELWQSIKDKLQSPVRKTRKVRGHVRADRAPLAGESALAHYTMLAFPRVECRAIDSTDWKKVKHQVEELGPIDFGEEHLELQTWSYDPSLFARENVVDRISLYLSIRHHPDERVSSEAERLLEDIQW